MHLTIHNIIYASEFVSLFIAGCIINQKQTYNTDNKNTFTTSLKAKKQILNQNLNMIRVG